MKKLILLVALVCGLVATTGCNVSAKETSVEITEEAPIEVDERYRPKLVAQKNGVDVYYAPFYFDANLDDWQYSKSRYHINGCDAKIITFEFDTEVPLKSNHSMSKAVITDDGYFSMPTNTGIERYYIPELGVYLDNPYYDGNIGLSRLSCELRDNGTFFLLDNGEKIVQFNGLTRIYLLDRNGDVVGLSNQNADYVTGNYIGEPVQCIYNEYSGRNGTAGTVFGFKREYVFSFNNGFED